MFAERASSFTQSASTPLHNPRELLRALNKHIEAWTDCGPGACSAAPGVGRFSAAQPSIRITAVTPQLAAPPPGVPAPNGSQDAGNGGDAYHARGSAGYTTPVVLGPQIHAPPLRYRAAAPEVITFGVPGWAERITVNLSGQCGAGLSSPFGVPLARVGIIISVRFLPRRAVGPVRLTLTDRLHILCSAAGP